MHPAAQLGFFPPLQTEGTTNLPLLKRRAAGTQVVERELKGLESLEFMQRIGGVPYPICSMVLEYFFQHVHIDHPQVW